MPVFASASILIKACTPFYNLKIKRVFKYRIYSIYQDTILTLYKILDIPIDKWINIDRSMDIPELGQLFDNLWLGWNIYLNSVFIVSKKPVAIGLLGYVR